MRSSDVPSFPDPQPGGRFAFPVNASPAFKSAKAECQKLLPNGGAAPAFSERALVRESGIRPADLEAQAGGVDRTAHGCRLLGDLRPRRSAILSNFSRNGPVPVVILCADSTSAQRKAGEPCRKMCPIRAWPSLLRTVGASPAQAHRCRALGKRLTSRRPRR
jgi:hypothetical protein